MPKIQFLWWGCRSQWGNIFLSSYNTGVENLSVILYSFRIMAIFYFINWIVAAETIEGGKLFAEIRCMNLVNTYIYIHINFELKLVILNYLALAFWWCFRTCGQKRTEILKFIDRWGKELFLLKLRRRIREFSQGRLKRACPWFSTHFIS